MASRAGGEWTAVCEQVKREQAPALHPFVPSTRVARNGSIADPSEALRDGDELALLPPVGGG